MILRKMITRTRERNSVEDRDADYCVFVTTFLRLLACPVWRFGSSSWLLLLLLLSSSLIGLLFLGCKVFVLLKNNNNRIISLPDDACQQASF